MSAGAALELHGLTLAYNGRPAVARVDLQAAPGEMLALVGPSGCGKTTLLRLIAGFERPDAGSVRVGGRLLAGEGVFVPPERRRVGMVFQDPALFPHLTVWENLMYGIPRRMRAQAAPQVERLAAQAGLAGLERRHPQALSAGERQRVALVRALAARPAVLLLDEPLNSLDAGLRLALREHARALLRAEGVTALFVTHDQEEALRVGDRLAVMAEGRIEQTGAPAEVFLHPASRFVARFLGQAELLPATARQGGLETELGLLSQPAPAAPGTPLDVAFRADDLALAPDPAGPDVITAVVFRGETLLCRVRLASGREVHVARPHTAVHAAGERVRVWFEPHHALPCFDGPP